ncbi:MAG: ketopantoate reductase [Myxococcales bacterium]|nr:ketopantoate reductase [Myxococcales bacterium]
MPSATKTTASADASANASADASEDVFEPDAPRVLIVGAGAVGQVYALHLVRGGAKVSVFVKPRHADACREGFLLYPLRGRGRRCGAPLRGLEVLTRGDEVAARRWDQVWLCVSSTGLRGDASAPEDPSWLDEFVPAVGDATIVCLQPDLGDRAYLTRRAPASQLVTGLISFVAYQHPLPGASAKRPIASAAPGVAFYETWLSPNVFSGERERTREVVAALRRGGGTAKRVADVPALMAFTSSLLIPGVAALEVAGWSIRQLTTTRRALARDAIRQATAAARPGYRRGLVWLVTSAPVLWLVGALMPWLAPFDLETYFRYHFTKVGDQTRLMLATYRERAAARGSDHDALDRLLAALGPASA